MRAVSFEARGKDFALRLNMSAMCRYQDRSGETIGTAIQAVMMDSSDMIRARRIFWASLSETMTEEEAGDLMEEIGLAKAFGLVGECLKMATESLTGETEASASGNGEKPRKKAAT